MYGPSNDDASFYESLYEFLGQNEENGFLIGGDFNTVLYSVVGEFGGLPGTYKNCQEKIKWIYGAITIQMNVNSHGTQTQGQ